MPPGTATPPKPAPDLIDRFNAIIDDMLACLAVESLRAAGVPWVLRIILAPLLRRRIARWSAAFSAAMADARAGRRAEPAVAAADDVRDGQAEIAVRTRPVSARQPVGSASTRGRRTDGPRCGEASRAVAISGIGGARLDNLVGTSPGGTSPGGTSPGGTSPGGTSPGGTARVRADAPITDSCEQVRSVASRRSRSSGRSQCGSRDFFRHVDRPALHIHFVTITQRCSVRNRSTADGGTAFVARDR